MGSQTLEILRQGVWASLTGGWFYDPHQNVFCNAVHLYIWLFLLCAPFITYLIPMMFAKDLKTLFQYFPKTFTTWGVYCFATALTITVLKIINMALHILYDRAQNLSESNLKKPLKGLRESRGEDDCGIEMQVLGADMPSQTSAEQPINGTSGANSMISIDCQDQVTSTIDLKVDVHRKNSSESSDSIGVGAASGPPSYRSEMGKMNNHRRSLKVKSKSEERPSKNPVISEEMAAHECDRHFQIPSTSQMIDGCGEPNKFIRMEDKRKSCLERQSSFDVSEASVLELSLARQQSVHICCDIDVDNFSEVINKRGNHKSTKLQRHRSSESNDDRHRRNHNLFLNHREQQSGSDIRNPLQSLASDLYLESNYAKSDLGIESIENNNSKIYLLQQPKPMRKDSSSTMSALQLPVASAQSNNARKRRHSNTGCKPINNQTPSVRRIKSAALEISCPQPSVSNLSPHPNSAEAISGQQIKNPQSAMLPPPSKCLVRNPHLNLCPKLNSLGNNSSGIITEPVYPIAEQADEKSLNEAFIFPGELDSENENAEKMASSARKRCSTTESESDLERPRTQSTDSETDNNGSRSPLLNKTNRHGEKYKNMPEEAKQKLASAVSNFCDVANSNSMASRYKNGDSGCPSSDCEQTSASSKDMLLSKDKVGESSFKLWSGYSEKDVKEEGAVGPEISQREEENAEKKATKDAKHLGAIPKTSTRKEDLNDYVSQKRALGAIPKSTSGTSSSASSRSFSAESFSNEIYKSYKDQWVMVGGPGHSQGIQPSLTSGCMHSDILFSNYPRRTFIDTNYRFQPKMRRSSESTRRIKDGENGGSKLEEISTTLEFGSNDLQNTGNGTLSIQGLMNEHYSFENAITSDQRPSAGQILNISHVEFNDSVCCDYWRPCSLTTDKPMQPKRFYKYRLHFFGRHELKISMDRLQLLALFDRDLQWFHVILAIILSAAVCLLGSVILQMGFYKDIFAFLFCVVIAGSQYSLLKSVQPDAASPIHGFNKTVAYSRPIYFCLCSGLLVLSHHLALELSSNETWNSQQKEIRIFGILFSPVTFLYALTKIMSIVLLLFPVFFSLGLFPQINTFCMYILEQVDMHIFGGSAACSLAASMICVLKSFLAVCILYGPAYGGLIEQKGTQHVLFSIFCALLITISYHLSRTASDFTHIWSIIKSSIISYPEDEEEDDNKSSNTTVCQSKPKPSDNSEQQESTRTTEETKEDTTCSDKNDVGPEHIPTEIESPDPLPKKLQQTVNTRLKNDLVVSCVLALIIFGLHCSTVFTVLQPDLNIVLYSIAGILGFFLHYILPQMRKHLPWLCFSTPILKQNEFGRFEVSDAAKIMWFEVVYVCLCFLERNVLYPLIFISTLTADSSQIVQKFGTPLGVAIVCVCGLKCVRSAYSDVANQYLILIFSVLLFKIDFSYASETFLVDYFVVSVIFRKSCDFLLKMQFIVTYIAPWQITWGSAFHAFAQPFSVPHSAMLFMQAGISAILSTPLNPFLGSAIFLTSYARPIKFWERDYNTRRIDHSNTRLSSQLERDLGADDNNLNSIFYEHLTRSLQHSLCGDLLLGRWGPVNQGDCFVLASDYLNCLVHIIELGNGLCTFQMRGLEFRGTYCQQREVEAISEGVEDNDGCCCCTPGHLPRMLSANAMFSTRWLAWQVVAAQYVLEGYSISENLATATLQVFEFRKVLITYYIKSIIYYVTRNSKLDEWLSSGPIQDALTNTLNRQFVDLDPIFNYNLDEDFDFRALGITRTSFCSVYMAWIQFCYVKRKHKDRSTAKEEETDSRNNRDSQSRERNSHTNSAANVNSNDETAGGVEGASPRTKDKNKKLNNKNEDSGDSACKNSNVTKDSPLVSLCLALGLLARRTLATASHSSLSGVEFFLHGLHALFKGDFRITSPRDEWVFADMELLHGVVAPAVKMALKLHQDHFSSPDEYLDPAVLYEAITSHSKDLVISHEADPMWRSAVLRGAPNLLALRHVMEDGSDEYRIIRLTKRFLNFRVIKLNRECVRGLWAGQQQELIYLRNRNPERGSIQNAKQALRNIINSSCDQPIGYPIYVSPLTTSYAETNEQLCRIIGGSITLDTIRSTVLDCWNRIRQRCREGCSSGSGGLDCDTTNEVPGVYFSPAAVNTTSSTLPYGSQSLSCAGTRGSLASMNKPTSSTLIAGFLNRDRDQERENVRERSSKKNVQSRSERERRATLPITSSAVNENSKDFTVFKEGMGSTNSGLRHADIPDASHSTKMFCSSGNLGAEGLKCISGDTPKRSSSEQPGTSSSHEKGELVRMESMHSLIELNKKVIIVDGTEIYDCLDLGRRIDVVWPNERMRACGGRSSWKEWSPKEGMVGYVVHYWQPNHPDQRFRSNVNRTLYLVEIGERFVPVGESGIKEYNQMPGAASNRAFVSPVNDTSSSVATDASIANDIPTAPKKSESNEYSNPKENFDYSNCDSNNQTENSFNDDDMFEGENYNVESVSSASLSSGPDGSISLTANDNLDVEKRDVNAEMSISSQIAKFTEKETS